MFCPRPECFPLLPPAPPPNARPAPCSRLRLPRPTPRPGLPRPNTQSYRYAVSSKARDHGRFFVLLTDHMDKKAWPDVRVLAEYRHQHLIEGHCGFRWLKGPAGAAPMFLNTPKRIAALGLVFVLALMVRNYIEHVVRARLAALPGKLTLPNMDDRPTRKPSAENVFWLFRQVGVVLVRQSGVLIERRAAGFDPHTDLALSLLDVPRSAFTTPRKRSATRP